MIDDIKKRIEQYFEWIRDNTTLKDAGNNWVQITTPHLDHHNDCLQIYPYNDSLEIEHGKINGLHALVLFEVTAEINRLDRK